MKAAITVDLKPFTVPNYVIVKNTGKSGQVKQYALGELDADLLERLCEEFTNSIFKRAGKKRPGQHRNSGSKEG